MSSFTDPDQTTQSEEEEDDLSLSVSLPSGGGGEAGHGGGGGDEGDGTSEDSSDEEDKRKLFEVKKGILKILSTDEEEEEGESAIKVSGNIIGAYRHGFTVPTFSPQIHPVSETLPNHQAVTGPTGRDRRFLAYVVGGQGSSENEGGSQSAWDQTSSSQNFSEKHEYEVKVGLELANLFSLPTLNIHFHSISECGEVAWWHKNASCRPRGTTQPGRSELRTRGDRRRHRGIAYFILRTSIALFQVWPVSQASWGWD